MILFSQDVVLLLHDSTDLPSKGEETEEAEKKVLCQLLRELEATGRPAGEGHGEEEDDEVEEDDDELHLEHGEEELHHEHQQQRVEYDRYGHLQRLHRRRPEPDHQQR